MPKRVNVVSFHTVTTPLTESGIRLGEPSALTTPRFLIHECGYLPQGSEKWNVDGIISPFWRLWYTQGESHWAAAGGRRVDLGPDRIVFAPAQVVYSTGNRQAAPQLWLHFSLVPDYAFEAIPIFHIPLDSLLQEQLAALIRTHKPDVADRVRVLYHHAASLLHTCLAYHPLQLRPLPDILRTILHTIENSPDTDLSNDSLARLANLSKSGFIRWFEQHMNQSPGSYVQRVRLDKASRLLMFSEQSIEQIAADLGFGNRHYFSRAFAKHAGCGPGQFRRQHRLSRE